jgi:hypothetical protein
VCRTDANRMQPCDTLPPILPRCASTSAAAQPHTHPCRNAPDAFNSISAPPLRRLGDDWALARCGPLQRCRARLRRRGEGAPGRQQWHAVRLPATEAAAARSSSRLITRCGCYCSLLLARCC